MKQTRRPALPVYFSVTLLLLCGCQLGPGRLKVASSHYSEALRIADSEQLLINLARLRYSDLPIFLAVTSLSTQFEFSSTFGVNGTVVDGGSNSVGIGGGMVFSERPTITFAKKGGEKFLKRMLTPVDVAVISLLAESGWRNDRLLALAVEDINGVENASTASGPTPAKAPEYRDFTEAMRLIQKLKAEQLLKFEYETRRDPLSTPLAVSKVDGRDTVRAIEAGVEFEALPDGRVQLTSQRRVLVMRFQPATGTSTDVQRLRELLRLETGRQSFQLVEFEDREFHELDTDALNRVVALDTRSLIGVMYFAANGIEVPQAHLDAGYATTTLDSEGKTFDWSSVLGNFFRVHSSDSMFRPDNAAVAVQYRDHWFYIADDDESSKTTFSLLYQLYVLQAGDFTEQKPVLTLPVGR